MSTGGRLLRRCVDIVMYFALCFIAGSGLLIGYRLAPCSRGGSDGDLLCGLGRHDWGTLHLWGAYLFLALLIVHLIVNYAFIRNVILTKSHVLPALLVAAGLAMIMWFTLAPVTIQPGGKKCGSMAYPSLGPSLACPGKGACNAGDNRAGSSK